MFELHNLGWSSFQQLCLTITREILGQTVESFLDCADGGRDGAFTDTWKTEGSENLEGSFVIQCKHTSKRDSALRLSDLSDEIEKARKLVANGVCETYVLMTNAGVSGALAKEISKCLKKVGVKHVRTFGSTWIDQQIRESTRLRMLVPRVYGLGDLSQILDERAYSQARAILGSMREDLAKVVVTDAYRRSVEAINTHGFVLLIGEPAAGESTVASLLAMAALDQWNALPLKLDAPTKVVDRWNPNEPSQFFWLDDAFGVNQYEDFLVRGWNHALPQIRSMLRHGAKIVMTSRDYIYNRARRDLKDSAFPLLNESRVVIDVHDLSSQEKHQILYNHLKLGNQPMAWRTKVKPYLEEIAKHRRFIPETARRLADPLFTKGLAINHQAIGEFVEKREQLLQEVLQGLDNDSKAALALIFMRNGSLQSPISLDSAEVSSLDRLGSNQGGCISALEALNGSLVIHRHQGNDSSWSFKHPTIGDAYAEILVRSPEHLGIFIQGSAPDRLVDQVTCGDVGLEKAVVLPSTLFPQMIAKLSELSQLSRHKSAWLSEFNARWDLFGFLARRCSKEFLTLYIQQNPGLLDQVGKPGLRLDSVPEARLAKRLFEVDLMPEDIRKRFVETVTEYAIDGLDLDALGDAEIRSFFTPSELETLILGVRTKLIPRLGDVRREWQSDYSTGDSPEDYMQGLFDIFAALKREFEGDEEAIGIIKNEHQIADDWINEHSDTEPEISPRELASIQNAESTNTTRSIFDDIDA